MQVLDLLRCSKSIFCAIRPEGGEAFLGKSPKSPKQRRFGSGVLAEVWSRAKGLGEGAALPWVLPALPCSSCRTFLLLIPSPPSPSKPWGQRVLGFVGDMGKEEDTVE